MRWLKWALAIGMTATALSGLAFVWVMAATIHPPGLAAASGSQGEQVRHRLRRHHRLRETPEARSEPPAAQPQSPAPATPVASGKSEQAPALKPQEQTGPPPPPEKWTDAEVLAARSDCTRRLSGLHAVFAENAPLKEGVCGLPGPIRLDGFGESKGPNISFSPAPVLSCKLAEALHRWIEDVVQPKAMQHLQAAIVRVTNLSSYQCRSRYDDPGMRISEHAFANAIDLAEFLTAKGEHVAVLDHWGGTDERAAFLHEIHAGACEIFGTTLGPEANEAHKNHFHLDMKDRRKPLCDFTPAQERAKKEIAQREAAAQHGVDFPAAESSPRPVPAPAPAIAPPPAAPSSQIAAEDPQSPQPRRRRHRRHAFRFSRS